jgi:hypothetical protein
MLSQILTFHGVFALSAANVSLNHAHPWSTMTLRARDYLPSASEFVICFCICHLRLLPTSVFAICSLFLLTYASALAQRYGRSGVTGCLC